MFLGDLFPEFDGQVRGAIQLISKDGRARPPGAPKLAPANFVLLLLPGYLEAGWKRRGRACNSATFMRRVA